RPQGAPLRSRSLLLPRGVSETSGIGNREPGVVGGPSVPFDFRFPIPDFRAPVKPPAACKLGPHMGWTRCPHCGFTQVASEKCLRCAEPLPKPVARPTRSPGGATAPPPARASRFSLQQLSLGAGALLVLA